MNFDRDAAEMLVREGFAADLIERGSTNMEPSELVQRLKFLKRPFAPGVPRDIEGTSSARASAPPEADIPCASS